MIPQLEIESTTREEFDRKLEELSFEVLGSLIDRILIYQDFKEKGIQIPEVYVENEYEQYISTKFNGDRAEFLKWLRDQAKTTRQFREELQENMVVDYMRGQMRKSQSYVSPEKIREYYEENKLHFFNEDSVHLRQIVLTPTNNETLELLMQRARNIVNKLDKGDDFIELAKQYTTDDLKESGGDFGWVKRTDIQENLAKVAFNLGEGEYSEPIVVDEFIMILFVEEKVEEGVMPLEDVRDEIEKILSAKLAREAHKRWLEKLRKEAYIQYYL